MFVDVLHHTNQIGEVLAEAARVSRRFLLIKGPLSESSLDFHTLKLWDWIGNRPHGVVLPNNYRVVNSGMLTWWRWLRLKKWQYQIPLLSFSL